MKALDKYIIRKYLSAFFFTALLFTIISSTIDYSEKLNHFSNNDLGIIPILHYYSCFIPYINGLLWPLFALIAVIFFTSRMAQDAEVISILNAGVSYNRMMVPYLVSAIIITGFLLFGNHFLIPKANDVRIYYENISGDKQDEGKNFNVHIMMDSNHLAFIRIYNRKDSTARNVRFEKYKEGKLVQTMHCKEMNWVAPPNRWELRNYEVRQIGENDEELMLFNGGVLDTAINIHPSDFSAMKSQIEIMDSRELQGHIDLLLKKGTGNIKKFQAEYYRRTSEPITVIILTIIGMAVASRKVRGGIGLHLAIGITLGALFIFLSKISITFATNDELHPLIGVWIPNVVFSFVALYLVRKAQK